MGCDNSKDQVPGDGASWYKADAFSNYFFIQLPLGRERACDEGDTFDFFLIYFLLFS